MGYPEDVMLRDESFLHIVLLTDLQHEEEQIEKETRDLYAKLSPDDGVPCSNVHGLSLCTHVGVSGTWEEVRDLCETCRMETRGGTGQTE